MFRTHPDFEYWRIRTVVEWQGCARPLVGRLAMWPDSDAIILICTFEDEQDAGDWAVRVNYSFYPLLAPQQQGKFLQRVHVFDVATREPREVFRPRAAQIQRLRELLRTLWRERRVMRLFHLPDLPAPPRVASESQNGLMWNSHMNIKDCTPFTLDSACASFAISARDMKAELERQWQIEQSDASFAWRWGHLDYNGHWSLLFDTGNQNDALIRVMPLILRNCERLWQSEEHRYWRWDLNIRSGYSTFSSLTRSPPKTSDIAQKWGIFLRQYYQSCFREDLIERHECARRFIEQKDLPLIVQGVQAPTAHEQLEAKLQLRDWLQDKATPAEVEQLLAT